MAVPAPPTFRRATPGDADALAAGIADGLETYRAFMPAGWEPPAASVEREHLDRLLPDDTTWCLLAEADGRLVGQVAFLPAARSVHPVEDGSLAHLRNLFVDRAWWGTALARDLHARALAAARERGFAAMRLFTPAEHGRARRFYEREGWVAARQPFDEPQLGMQLVEYRHDLTDQEER